MRLSILTLMTVFSFGVFGGQACYIDYTPSGGTACGSVNTKLVLNGDKSYVVARDLGKDSCIATSDFAKKADLSLGQVKQLMEMPGTRVTCQPYKGQMYVTGITAKFGNDSGKGGRVCYNQDVVPTKSCSNNGAVSVEIVSKLGAHALYSNFSAYVVIGAGMNSCLAKASFAQQNGLSLLDAKDAILDQDSVVTCTSDKGEGGQMVVSKLVSAPSSTPPNQNANTGNNNTSGAVQEN